MEWPLFTMSVTSPEDVVAARQRARELAAQFSLDSLSQTRFAASVSEIARNALSFANSGSVAFALRQAPSAALLARITDSGPGIEDIDAVLEGSMGNGNGIINARRLVDEFTIGTSSRGTEIILGKRLPDSVRPTRADAIRIAARLERAPSPGTLSEMQTQTRELVASLGELRSRQEELERLNTELEDTNRGVVALYAELDERAEQLRQASELKSRFLSNMSHEFRTPLNSILALSSLLLDRTDGTLTSEQERQVTYIRRSAESLTELVNDLLDLAKVEAGKLELRPVLFTIEELFGALRGVMKPLQQNDAVELIFDDPVSFPALFTDEAKVAQVLRNLISNALKFTERGEVRVTARFDHSSSACRVVVADTGIGIAPENHELVFQEFSQVANRLQFRSKGTGLGLPLSRRLAELLGGSLTLESCPGQGSAFGFIFPAALRVAGTPQASHIVTEPTEKHRVLVIDDEETPRYVLRQMLSGQPGLRILEAETGVEGLRIARQERPHAILLDLRLPDIPGQDVLDRLADDASTRDIPVIICTSSVLGPDDKARLWRASAMLSKATLTREVVTRCLQRAWGETTGMPMDGAPV
jgi:signal transduction histidine kinase/ActR/RegA family two-component response regulator